MTYSDHIAAMNELSSSEGVFTTAQAQRLGIPRDALAHACAAGRAERICRGAYRLAGTQSRETDALAAIWKLTDPARFTWERQAEWDGVTVGGTTAASLQGIGDFFASPYRIYAPRRINSRLEAAAFAARAINAEDVSWEQGLPLTRPERTLIDLCLDSEDPSLIADAYLDARDIGLDYECRSRLSSPWRGWPASPCAIRTMPGASRGTSPRVTWPSSTPKSPRPLQAAEGPRGVEVARKTIMASLDLADQVDEA